MTKAQSTNKVDLEFDSKIEWTINTLRRGPEQGEEEKDIFKNLIEKESEEKKEMATQRTLKELATPNLNQQPLCITFPTFDTNITFELESGLIHLLLSFHGLAGEDPHKHLKEFHIICTSMKLVGVTKE